MRTNREIRAATVRVIDAEGNQLGILALADALAEAAKGGFDLVEVAPNSTPPVCRIMDYGKYRYQQSKKLQDAKKSQTVIQIKEIRLRPKTEAHDLQVKIRHVRKFLEQRDKVKITMMFRGREITYAELGRKIMEEIRESLADGAVIEQHPKLEGRNMIMILAPKK
ncbi:MAG: Translation initiation factor IF-3 [Syntrophus sp. PtaB.Bin138]|nr:MAG: Translation initiation factor IF-3 [Syntrophus sp. PtaB.Bin138]